MSESAEAKDGFVHVLKHGPVPDIGDIIQKKVDTERDMGFDRSWRVTSWIKMLDPESVKTGNLLSDLLAQAAADSSENGLLMVFCHKHEATHVSGSGVGGCILSLEEIKVIGRVNWSEEQIEAERQSALRLVGEYIF